MNKRYINAGKYNKRISIYKPVTGGGADDLLEENDSENFVKVLDTWAEVRTIKGMTLIASGSDFEKAYTRFTIRYPRTVAVDRKMRVIFKEKIYRIEYINNVDEDDAELELQCAEVTQ